MKSCRMFFLDEKRPSPAEKKGFGPAGSLNFLTVRLFFNKNQFKNSVFFIYFKEEPGILQKVIPIKQPKAQKLQLKSQKMKYHLMCTFYEIDRQLPKLAMGTWYRCIILLRYNKEYQCVSIRSATSNELKYLDKLVIESSKSMAILLKSSNIF
ncbi:uncharacterized protein TNCT_550801 [Trichonephila clavata]|uniref:Uncharacterized protein n=1 Tax=Trichonephila clavata TaxID=2740835 RepID=A0A8X6KXL8_TRICU|nr:uncharacterized protein TNCT_550801 [Trichonephila clavata]